MLFFFTCTATTAIYTLSLHDALPISSSFTLRSPSADGLEGLFVGIAVSAERGIVRDSGGSPNPFRFSWPPARPPDLEFPVRDRKSTRLNSSHGYISYAVFCLKKKNNK